jgi:hypothetical protein
MGDWIFGTPEEFRNEYYPRTMVKGESRFTNGHLGNFASSTITDSQSRTHSNGTMSYRSMGLRDGKVEEKKLN